MMRSNFAGNRVLEAVVKICGGLAFVLAMFFATCEPAEAAEVSISEQAEAIKVFNAVNEVRTANGLNALVWSDSMDDYTADRAEAAPQCFKTGSHGDWTMGYRHHTYLGENLAYGLDSASVCDAWLASPAHAANLLADDYVSAAVGVYYTADGTEYIAMWYESAQV